MYCSKCGVQMDDVARFCSACGRAASNYAGATYASAASATPKPLVRVLQGKWIGGVCTGLARYWDLDPALVRILFIAMAICPVLPAIVPYIVCWIVMPQEPAPAPASVALIPAQP